MTVGDPVTFRSPQAGGSITVNGQITAVDNATVTFDTPTLNLNGDIVTAGEAVTITDDLVLTTNLTIDTTDAAATCRRCGHNASAVRSMRTLAANNRTLTLMAGTGGDITFTGVVGGYGAAVHDNDRQRERRDGDNVHGGEPGPDGGARERQRSTAR